MNRDDKLIVFDIQRYCIHDGPGIRTNVFLKGCPLSCLWCANPESQKLDVEFAFFEDKCIGDLSCVEICPKDAITFDKKGFNRDKTKCDLCLKCAEVCHAGAIHAYGKEMSVEEITNECLKDKSFYEKSGGGVTLSGGEPFFQFSGALSLLKKLKENDVHTAIETSGYISSENLEEINKYIDLYLYDLKVIDNDKHIQYTGVSNQLILDNLKMLDSKDENIIIRIPIIPGINNSKKDICEMLEFLGSLKHQYEVNLLAYHKLGVFKYKALGREYEIPYTHIPEDEKMNEIKWEFEKRGYKTNIGG